MEITITAPVWLLVTISALPLLALIVGFNSSPRLSMKMAQETLEHFEQNRRDGGGGWHGHDITPHIRSFVHPTYGKVVIRRKFSVSVSRPGYGGQVTYMVLGESIVFSPGVGIRMSLLSSMRVDSTRQTARKVLQLA